MEQVNRKHVRHAKQGRLFQTQIRQNYHGRCYCDMCMQPQDRRLTLCSLRVQTCRTEKLYEHARRITLVLCSVHSTLTRRCVHDAYRMTGQCDMPCCESQVESRKFTIPTDSDDAAAVSDKLYAITDGATDLHDLAGKRVCWGCRSLLFESTIDEGGPGDSRICSRELDRRMSSTNVCSL